MFEANCSRQMGQHKKKIFHQMFLCLHGGVTKVRVSDADRMCLCMYVSAAGTNSSVLSHGSVCVCVFQVQAARGRLPPPADCTL